MSRKNASKFVELSTYMTTVRKMMNERHPDCRFTIIASYDQPSPVDPTKSDVTVRIVGNDGDIPAIIKRLQRCQKALDEQEGNGSEG
jgi:hypothetical protein